MFCWKMGSFEKLCAYQVTVVSPEIRFRRRIILYARFFADLVNGFPRILTEYPEVHSVCHGRDAGWMGPDLPLEHGVRITAV
ncbi:hypothetical protein OOT00_05145 [Desulfobotulus sp. H1]|uniref:Uncharacterized protein n=1 Tax=Desulfobotulus pelophilus TaxID=2823377 RepID=A0ABT3N7D5_9BACT|nr:hypothetical protein [Desulfobotulus pelophilus]MCW7753370.1 hypothetical protein [Desulfobotulus pelophilus]